MEPSYGFVCSSIMALMAIYDLTSPFFVSVKQRAWIVTTFASLCMTFASLPFIYDFAMSRGSVLSVQSYGILDLYALRFFQSYLVSDLMLGAFSYPDQVNLLSGWIHHSVYVFIVELAIRRAWTHIFCLACIMELPTFVMGMGKLFPALRSTVLFATSFAATRILLHATLIIMYSRPHNLSTSRESFIPTAVLSAMFILHAFWFTQCIRGFFRRAKTASSSHVKTFTPIVVTSTLKDKQLQQPSAQAYRLLARSNIWRRRRIHRRMVYDKARRLLPGGIGRISKLYDLLPERQALYDVVGLGSAVRQPFPPTAQAH